MEAILFPTDFSPNAQHALDYTLKLLEGNPFRLLLFHTHHTSAVEGTPPKNSYLEEIMLEDDSEHKKKMIALKESISKKYALVETEIVMKLGKLIDNLAETVKSTGADMVIMGTQGAGGVKEVIFGSNTMHAISRLEIPVLAIPEKAVFRKPEILMYAADLEHEEEKVIRQALKFAARFNAKLKVLHVVNDDQLKLVNPQTEFDDLKTKFKGEEIEFKITESQKLMDGIAKGLKDSGAQILVLAKHKRGLIDKLFTRSYTKKLAYHSEIPLLALHKSN